MSVYHEAPTDHSSPADALSITAQRMQDTAQQTGDRFLYSVAELLEHLDQQDPIVLALGCQVAVNWSPQETC